MNDIISHIEQNFNSLLESIITNVAAGSDSWEKNIREKSKINLLDTIANVILMVDNIFFQSETRKQKFLSKDRRPRTIVTTLGTLTFKRRRYKDRGETKKYFCLIDALLGIEPYSRLSNETKEELLRIISEEALSYQKAANRFDISKTSVYRLLKTLDFEDITVELSNTLHCENLHIVADEDHISLQKPEKSIETEPGIFVHSNSYIIKHVTLYTDIKQVSKNRNELQDRVILTPFPSETNNEFYKRVDTFIQNNYVVKESIYLYGDGAGWIKSLCTEIGATFILDKFHMSQAVIKVSGGKRNKEVNDFLNNCLKNDNQKGFFKKLDEINEGVEISPTKQKNIDYIKNQWKHYQKNFTLPKALVCCAEGINSHYFANKLSSRPKGFSKENAHKISFLQTIAHSKHKILKKDLKGLVESEKEVTWLKGTKSSYMPKSCELPALAIGKSTNLHQTLRGIIHNINL